MHKLSLILSDLRAAIAVRAARDRMLVVMLCAVWGRIARMGTRLERLIAQWRAGKLPTQPRPRAGGTRSAATPGSRPRFPNSPGWLMLRVRETAAFGSQLQHLLSEPEWAEFLAAVPQAGRILRPLCRMLLVDVVPPVLKRALQPLVPALELVIPIDGCAPIPPIQFLRA